MERDSVEGKPDYEAAGAISYRCLYKVIFYCPFFLGTMSYVEFFLFPELLQLGLNVLDAANVQRRCILTSLNFR
jgi:hypothetical protein